MYFLESSATPQNDIAGQPLYGGDNIMNAKKLYHKAGDAEGFTLVELMVSLVLASLMMIALTGTFILQSRAYTATRMSTELQDNARTALDTIALMVRNAGLGITKSDTFQGNVAAQPAYDSAAFCFYTPNPLTTDYICNYINPSAGDTYTTATMDGTQCQNNGWTGCPPYGTDSLTFAYREPQYFGENLSVDPTKTPPQIGFDDTYPYFGISSREIGFLIDPNHLISALVTINGTGVSGPGHVDVPINSNPSFFNEIDTITNPNNQSGGVSIFNNGYYQKVDVVHIYVDYNTNPDHPILMMQMNGQEPIPLADNIEDFQVQFVMDDSNLATNYNVMGAGPINTTNGTPYFPSFNNTYFDPTHNDPNTYPSENPQQNPMDIDAIIITIVARSDVPEQAISVPPMQWIADHNTTASGMPYPTPTLGSLASYAREVYQEIIQLPNIRTTTKLYDNRAL
jgi:type II secretory pathway pseudopilin PulG